MPTEKTPKGLDVPLPKRSEFFANLRKIAAAKRGPLKAEQKAPPIPPDPGELQPPPPGAARGF